MQRRIRHPRRRGIYYYHLHDVSGLPAPLGSIASQSWLDRIPSFFRRGKGWLALQLALMQGVRDENKLTNRVFFAFHPELQGRKLQPSQPRFKELSRQWIGIRDRLVRPVLRRLGIPAGRPRATTTTLRRIGALVPLLNKHRGDIPLPLLLGWIRIESAGRLDSTTSLDERGYFQLHPLESKSLKLDHKRLSSDSEYSVQSGIKLVSYYARITRRLGIPPGTDLFWHIVKFLHAMGIGAVTTMLKDMRANGLEPTAWAQIRHYAASQRERLRRIFLKKYKKAYDPVKWVRNVDKVFQAGHELAVGLGVR